MTLVGVTLILALYIFISLFLLSPYPLTIKLLAGFVLLVASLKYAIYRYFGGSFFAPDLPRPVMLVFETLNAAILLLFLLCLIKDVYLLIAWGSRTVNPSWQLPGISLTLKNIFIIVALATAAWGTWQSIRVPDVRRVEIQVKNLPASLDGFSIVQLTDLHIGPLLKRDWLQQVVDKTNALSPDVIALTGDYIDGSVAKLANQLEPLAELKAHYGVYGVTGNHEYYWNAGQWVPALENMNINILHNAHRVLTIGEDQLVIAGMPDIVESNFGGEGPDIEVTMQGAPDVPRILLAHQPRPAETYAPFADIQLAGHTHGGLMVFLQPLIAHYNNGFVAGQYQVNDMTLYVSAGTGLWAGFSNRIGVPSEITQIILRPASN